jgi:N5-(carboxyethyl)ornithine synthase
MDIAVIGTSKRENEKRVPIHPRQIAQINESVRKRLFFEEGYGTPFSVDDKTIEELTGNRPLPRGELIASMDAVIITKPVPEDLAGMREGTSVWGWIHCLQQEDMTQTAIDKKLTLIAWENMYYETSREKVHIFYRNNEMAGYCGVQHALQLRGIDGNFGPPRKICVFSLGSVSRGAIYALKGHGFSDITVYTRRPPYLAGNRIPGIKYRHLLSDGKGSFDVAGTHRKRTPVIDEITSADIIVNGILQNPNAPVYLIRDGDIERFGKECLVVDISCDIGMGFSFAQPTDFIKPVLRFGNITYYAVDHTPTLLWDSASWEISNGILQFLKDFSEEAENTALSEATDISHGRILNKEILKYQNRSPDYPHLKGIVEK